MNRLLLYIYIGLFTLVSTGYATPKIELSTKSIQFKKIIKGTQDSARFEIKNIGDDTLDIIKIRPSCDCMTCETPKTWLAPGEKMTATVTFDSSSKSIGFHALRLLVKNTDPSNPSIVIPVLASVEKPPSGLEISPSELDFGTISADNIPSLTITVSNTGNKPYRIIEVIPQNGVDILSPIQNKPVVQKDAVVIPVTIFSWVRPGSFVSSVTIRTSDPALPVFECKIKAQVTK